MRAPVLVLLALVAVVATAEATAVGPSPAHVTVVQLDPVVVRGDRFRPAERVTLLLRAGETWRRVVTTTSTGRLSARFAVTLSRCEPYTVQAFGSKGSRARTLPVRTTGCVDPSASSPSRVEVQPARVADVGRDPVE